MRTLAAVAAVVALSACGGGTGTRVYRGTFTDVSNNGTSTDTGTVSGLPTYMFQDSVDPTRWTIFASSNMPTVDATLTGESLTFAGGQGATQTDSSGYTLNRTLNTGSGTMNPQVLTYNVSVSRSTTFSGTTTTTTDTITFNGQRQ